MASKLVAYLIVMHMATVDRLTVACELLDRALRLYYEGDSYFASMHLAGAAEELLGVYVEKVGGTSAFKSFRASAVRLSRLFSQDGSESKAKDIGDLMNHAKNNTKHGYGPVSFDAKSEAKEVLDRAVSDYYFLMTHYELEETPLIRRFNQELVNA